MNLNEYTTIDTDVLIVGGGGAALKAALIAKENGVRVLIVTKGALGKSGATYYSVAESAGFACPNGHFDPTDSPEVYYNDIMKAASGVADPKLAEILANGAAAEKDYLEDLGLQFAKDPNGESVCTAGCFSSKRRNYMIVDHFKPLLHVLFTAVKKAKIAYMEGIIATNLIVKDGECAGIFAVDEKDVPYMIRAKSVILATGGASYLFKRNMYPCDITGDGYALAKRAGARIVNMEFVQAGIGLSHPEVNLLRHHLWLALPNLTNEKGEAFLSKYIDDPFCTPEKALLAKGRHFPFSSSDDSKYVEIGIMREINEGFPSVRGNVYLDFKDVDFNKILADPKAILTQVWPVLYGKYKSIGIDLYKDRLEITCFAHAINGGLLIDENSESSIKGLFAVGEVAAGPHGADRLGGNMSVTCQVFGRIAGRAAAARANARDGYLPWESSKTENDEFLAKIAPKSAGAFHELLARMQEKADQSLLIVRDEPGMTAFLDTLRDIELQVCIGDKAGDIVPCARMIELKNLAECGKMIATAALARKESRGSHYRSDYPNMNPGMGKMIEA